jgi:hypothetical protein
METDLDLPDLAITWDEENQELNITFIDPDSGEQLTYTLDSNNSYQLFTFLKEKYRVSKNILKVSE